MSHRTSDSSRDWLDFERYAVYGLGESGRGACRLLRRHDKSVIASDTASREELGETLQQCPDDLEYHFGANDPGDAELVVVSPGLPPDCEAIEDLERREIPYISELELAYAATESSIAAVTGTDGKTTTTSMLGAIAEASDRPSRVAGNIGTALSEVVDEAEPHELLVVEVSANQLWTSPTFRPDAAGFTNVAADHLDYFESLHSYRRAKRSMLTPMTSSDAAVFNDDDAIVRRWAERHEGPSVGYSLEGERLDRYDTALWSKRDALQIRDGHDRVEEVIPWNELALPGRHNRANAMCAAGVAKSVGLEVSAIRKGLSNVEPLPHRVEYVDTLRGVEFYDDSKATNVHSAIAGLESLSHPLVAIVGGLDKQLELDPLVSYLQRCARGVAIIGAIQDRMIEALEATSGEMVLYRAETLQDAVRWAFEQAKPHGVPVSLSPACSSFDMFESYVDRGEQYQRAIAELPPA